MEKKIEAATEGMHCGRCESKKIETTFEDYAFEYGAGENQIELTASVPVRKCQACGYQFLDEKTDDIQHEAVCKHLGVMTPAQVISLRGLYGLNRAQFAKTTKLGEATLARWEKSLLIQNAAYDNYLYLLGWKENLERIRSRGKETGAKQLMDGNKIVAKFREIDPTDEELVRKQAEFELQPTCGIGTI